MREREACRPAPEDATRKLQVAGGHTFVVSLPKGWVQRAGLEAGSRVRVSERGDGGLVLTPEDAAVDEGRAEIGLTVEKCDSAESLLRRVTAAYVSGARAIQLRHGGALEEEVRFACRVACERLLGLYVAEDRGACVVLEVRLDPASAASNLKVVRRMFVVAREMLEETARALEPGSSACAPVVSRIAERETELDRLHLLARRQVHSTRGRPHPSNGNRNGNGDRDGGPDPASLLLAAKFAESIGDYVFENAERFSPAEAALLPPAGRRVLSEAACEALSTIDLAVDAFFGGNVRAADQAVDRSRALTSRVRGMRPGDLLDLPGARTDRRCDLCMSVTGLLDSIERIGRYAKSTAELAIDSRIERAFETAEWPARNGVSRSGGDLATPLPSDR